MKVRRREKSFFGWSSPRCFHFSFPVSLEAVWCCHRRDRRLSRISLPLPSLSDLPFILLDRHRLLSERGGGTIERGALLASFSSRS